MSALFEMVLPSETLQPEELCEISGCARNADQIDWLTRNRWSFVRNRAGAPKVGRLYARLRLAGIDPSNLAQNNDSWQIDASKVR